MRLQNYGALVLGIALACFVYGCGTPENREEALKKAGPTAAATISLRRAVSCKIEALTVSTPLFLNRNYSCKSVPEGMQGLYFTAFKLKKAAGYDVTVHKDGVLWLLVPMQFDLAPLIADGWENAKARIPVTFNAKHMVVLKRDGVKGNTYGVQGNGWVNPILVSESIALK